MPLANTIDTYGGVAKTFHWLTALLVITLIPLGLIAYQMPYDTSEQLAQKAWLFSLHKTLGVAVFFVALARIAWALSQPKPNGLHPERRLETFAAETVHWLLYSSLVIAPLSGWIHHAASTGFAPIWWPLGQSLPLVPKSEAVSGFFGATHIVVTKVLGVSLVLHVAGALKHHVVDKDATLRRMWFGKADVVSPANAHRPAAPIIAAVVAWVAALGIGAGIGVFDARAGLPAPAELAEVQSDWQVQDGTLGITVTQFGSDVTGSFADWTAAISFDESQQNGKAGTVDVTVAIGSLQLGSVTDQAMGPDFFDVQTYPTARFQADLFTTGEVNLARGTVTIRDTSVPVEMYFSLNIDGDTATVSADLDLNRLDFNIGANMADETSLLFGVAVNVALTATRN